MTFAAGTVFAIRARAHYRTLIMTHLNHLFQAATTGSPADYATITETFSPAALAVIGEWINERFGKAP